MLPITNILTTVHPLIGPLTVKFPIQEVSLIVATVCPSHGSLAGSHAFYVSSFEFVTVWPVFLAVAVLKVEFPVAIVGGSVFNLEVTYSF
jgi:hypothetical protein